MTTIHAVAIQLLSEHAQKPTYATAGAAGMDVYACLKENVKLLPGQRAVIPCGFAMELPDGYEAQIRPRSGLAAKHGVTVLNAPGTIDSDYRGEVGVILINKSYDIFVVEHGMRVAQMVVAPVTRLTWTEVDDLSTTSRGSGGFGSTGGFAANN